VKKVQKLLRILVCRFSFHIFSSFKQENTLRPLPAQSGCGPTVHYSASVTPSGTDRGVQRVENKRVWPLCEAFLICGARLLRSSADQLGVTAAPHLDVTFLAFTVYYD
jgi:hypothetical protein